MDERVRSTGYLSFKFEGENSIEASMLLNSLSGMVKAYRACVAEEYRHGDCEVAINICAFQQGSVDVVLEAVISSAPLILPLLPNLLASTKTLLEIVKIKKELKGEKPLLVQKEGARIKIVNKDNETHYHNSTVYNIYCGQPDIDAGISEVFKAIGGSTRPALSISAGGEQVVVRQEEFKDMSEILVNEQEAENTQVLSSEIQEHLLLKSPDFLGKAKWQFIFSNKVIYASIEDEDFIARVQRGRIKLSAGAKIPARMQIQIVLNEKMETIQTTYRVLEVLGDVIFPENEAQWVMPEFDG